MARPFGDDKTAALTAGLGAGDLKGRKLSLTGALPRETSSREEAERRAASGDFERSAAAVASGGRQAERVGESREQKAHRILSGWLNADTGNFFYEWRRVTKENKEDRVTRMFLEGFEKVLGKPFEQRQERETAKLVTWLSTVKFFQKLDKNVKRELTKRLQVRKCESQQVVFKEGDVGDIFYVILYGNVSIWKGPPPPEGESWDDNALLAKAKTGDSFGELALMADKGKRAATVRCDSYTVFLTLSKDMYERSVKSVFEQGVRERVDFLCRVATFRMLSLTKLREISLYLSKKTVEAGTIVCEQGSEPDYLYITARGSVDVEQMISGFDNTPHFSDGYEGFEPDMYTPRSSLSSTFGNRRASHGSAGTTPPSPRRHHQLDSVVERPYVHLATLGPGAVFGADAILLQSTHTRRIVTREDSVFLCLSRHDVFRRLPQDALAGLRKDCEDHYYDEPEMVQKVLANQTWNAYKKNLVMGIVAAKRGEQNSTLMAQKSISRPFERRRMGGGMVQTKGGSMRIAAEEAKDPAGILKLTEEARKALDKYADAGMFVRRKELQEMETELDELAAEAAAAHIAGEPAQQREPLMNIPPRVGGIGDTVVESDSQGCVLAIRITLVADRKRRGWIMNHRVLTGVQSKPIASGESASDAPHPAGGNDANQPSQFVDLDVVDELCDAFQRECVVYGAYVVRFLHNELVILPIRPGRTAIDSGQPRNTVVKLVQVVRSLWRAAGRVVEERREARDVSVKILEKWEQSQAFLNNIPENVRDHVDKAARWFLRYRRSEQTRHSFASPRPVVPNVPRLGIAAGMGYGQYFVSFDSQHGFVQHISGKALDTAREMRSRADNTDGPVFGIHGQCLATTEAASQLDGLIPDFKQIQMESSDKKKEAAKLNNLVMELHSYQERNIAQRAGTGRRASIIRNPFMGNAVSSQFEGHGDVLETIARPTSQGSARSPSILSRRTTPAEDFGTAFAWPIPLGGDVGVEPRALASAEAHDQARSILQRGDASSSLRATRIPEMKTEDAAAAAAWEIVQQSGTPRQHTYRRGLARSELPKLGSSNLGKWLGDLDPFAVVDKDVPPDDDVPSMVPKPPEENPRAVAPSSPRASPRAGNATYVRTASYNDDYGNGHATLSPLTSPRAPLTNKLTPAPPRVYSHVTLVRSVARFKTAGKRAATRRQQQAVSNQTIKPPSNAKTKTRRRGVPPLPNIHSNGMELHTMSTQYIRKGSDS